MPRRIMSQSLATAIVAWLIVAKTPSCEAQIVDGQAQIAGTWRGNSECVLRNGACHDETNVYRFSAVAERPGWFSGAGSKIVNGKEISMGTLDWKYDAKSHILESKNPRGVFRLVIYGDKIEGTLLLPDATVYRRIHLAKTE